MSATENPRHFDALRLYRVMEGVSSLLAYLMLTIYVVYFATVAGLDPLEIVLVSTVFEATIFLFEIPTGVVADSYSRKYSIIIGFCLFGIGVLIEGLLPIFHVFLLAEVIAGIGATFTSGATEAWIADEVGEARAGHAFMRGAQVRTIGAIAGIILSVALASVRLNLPFVVTGIAFIGLAVFLVIFMPETGFRKASQRVTWQAMAGTLRQGIGHIKLRPVLLPILAIGFIFAFHSEGFDQLWQIRIVDNFTLPDLGIFEPVVWFGIIAVGANLLSLALNEIVRRRVNLNNHAVTARALMLIYGVIAVGILVFSLTGNFALAVAFYWLIAALRNTGKPMSDAWLNQSLEPSIRATMFSVNSQIGAMGEIVGGPPIGAIGRVFSLRAALAACGALLLLALPLFGFALRRQPVTVSESVNVS